MSEFIALEWENTQVCGVEASVSRGKVRIDKCFQLKWPEGTNPADQPQQSGRWLKEELARLGIIAKPAIVSLPREEAVVRPLELPDAPTTSFRILSLSSHEIHGPARPIAARLSSPPQAA
jgi:Tfp pilus assembly PilM family ATPase